MIYILQQPLLFVKIIFHYVIAVFVVGTFFVFRNFVEKFCVSWAFPLIECVAVWALKPPVPHTDVLKTHLSQSFSTELRKTKKITHHMGKAGLEPIKLLNLKHSLVYHIVNTH